MEKLILKPYNDFKTFKGGHWPAGQLSVTFDEFNRINKEQAITCDNVLAILKGSSYNKQGWSNDNAQANDPVNREFTKAVNNGDMTYLNKYLEEMFTNYDCKIGGSTRNKHNMSNRTKRCFDKKARGWKSKTFKNRKDCLTKQKGVFYEGKLNKNDVPNGKGTYVYTNGTVYDGEWKNGNKHGKGKESFKTGDVYEGQWKNGKKNGKVKHIFPDGSNFEGNYKNDKKNGHGKFTPSDGKTFEMNYKNGKHKS
jgi:hypothetical protein